MDKQRKRNESDRFGFGAWAHTFTSSVAKNENETLGMHEVFQSSRHSYDDLS
jgi:hypothetical protein